MTAVRVIAGDIASRPTARNDPLQTALEGVMPGAASAFLARIDEAVRQDTPIDTSGDIASTGGRIYRALGVMRLLTSKRSEPLERRLPILLQAVRVLQRDRTFDRDVETLPEYVGAARNLSQCGFRFVVFGHTHLARNVRLSGDAIYLNSGTWADHIRFPGEIVGGSERQALESLRAFVLDMAACKLTGWVSFAPTYVLLHINDSGRVACAELVDAGPWEIAVMHREYARSPTPSCRCFSPAACGTIPPLGRCPFLALSVHQKSANGSKGRHKAKAEDRPILRVMARVPATSRTPRQRAANAFFFRLLTGGLLVRIQPEEPIFSMTWRRRPIP